VLCQFIYYEELSVNLLRMMILLLFFLCLFLCTRYYRLVCCYSQSYLALRVSGSWSCWWAGWIKTKFWSVVRYFKLYFVLTSSIYLKRSRHILFIRTFVTDNVYVSYVKQFEGVYSVFCVVASWFGYIFVLHRP
jgi:hypothetical protein